MTITRRGFLEGATAFTVSPSTAWAGGDGFRLEERAGTIVVHAGDAEPWILDPKLIARGARVRREAEREVVIDGFTFGGAIEAGLRLHFSPAPGAECHVHAEWRLGPAAVRSAAVPWKELDRAGLKAPLSRELLRMISRAVGGDVLRPPGRAVLRIDKALVVQLDGTGAPFTLFDGRLEAEQVALTGLPAAATARLTPRQGTLAMGRAGRADLQLLAAGKRFNVMLGRGERPVKFDATLVARHAGRLLLRVDVVAQIGSDGRGDDYRLVGRRCFGTVSLGRYSVEIQAPDEAEKPIEIRTERGRVRRLDGTVSMHGSTVSLPGAERTRLDLHGQPLRLLLSEGGRDPGARDASPHPVLALDDPARPLTLPLNCATLRVWRGADLLALTYRFKDIDLHLGPPPALRPRRVAAGCGAACPSEPVIAVEFPPQHIMERSFLRQTTELPDAGDRVPPATLRAIARLGPAASAVKRKEVQDAKISAEQHDALGPEDATISPPGQAVAGRFEQFVAKWRQCTVTSLGKPAAAGAEKCETYAAKYGEWIGPDGLFDLSSRRAARTLAMRLRVEALTGLGDRLDAKIKEKQAFQDSDYADFKATLPVPEFPMTALEARKFVEDAQKDERDRPAAGPDAPGAPAHEAGYWPRQILREAGERSPELEEFWSEARRVRQAAKLPGDSVSSDDRLVFRDWPYSATEWSSILGSPPVPDVPAAPVGIESVLVGLLQAAVRSRSDTRIPGSAAADQPREAFGLPVEAWMAEPSRLAFRLNGELGLTLAHLTDFQRLELVVEQRAARLPTAAGHLHVHDILKAQGLPMDPDPAVRMQRVRTMVSEPSCFLTAIEAPTRLVLSPDQNARWRPPLTSRGMPGIWRRETGHRAIWQVVLREKDGPSLRAIYSPDYKAFAAGTFAPPKQRDGKIDETWRPPGSPKDSRGVRTALSPADRGEIVALTSVYGLPVIATPNRNTSSQFRPDDTYEINTFEPREETAVFLPVPLRARRLALGATGATLDLDTAFPAVTSPHFRGDPDAELFRSPSLQRFRSLIEDGSDTVTTVVRRGYLFPFGHNAALIKVTTPRLRPVDPGRPDLGYTVEQATHLYIEVTNPVRNYPAVGQYYDGRDCQARVVTLLTQRTPDLLDPGDDPVPRDDRGGAAVNDTLRAGPHGSVRGWVSRGVEAQSSYVGRLAGRVFWPRTDIGIQGIVRFWMRIDGSGPSMSMPLMFVDHTAAADAATLDALCAYYNAETAAGGKPADWNLMRHNGALRTYAQEERRGECTFATDWQRIQAVGGSTSFRFTPALLSAEQPPFYPRTVLARVRPQQVQGLTGSAAPELDVAYAADYAEKGFFPRPGESASELEIKHHPRQTFLVVTSATQARLDMGTHGDQGGTVARRELVIAGLHRKLGPVGGPVAPPLDLLAKGTPKDPRGRAPRAPDRIGGRPPATAVAAISSASAVDRHQTTAAAADTNPNEFIKNCFGDSRLLGLIRLSDIIALLGTAGLTPPVLEEINDFASDNLSDIAAQLKPFIKDLHDALKEEKAVQHLLPGLWKAVQLFEGQVDKAADKSGNAIDLATSIWTSGQEVVRELENVTRTPISVFAERARGFILDIQPQVTNTVASFAPWRPYYEDLIAALTRSAEGIQQAIIVVAVPPAEQADITKRVREALAKTTTWQAADLIGAVAHEVAKDDAALESRLKEQLRPGAYFALIKDLLGGLNVSALALDQGIGWLQRALDFDSLLRRLAAMRSQVCGDAGRALHDAFLAAFPLPSKTLGDLSEIKKAAKRLLDLKMQVEKQSAQGNAPALNAAILALADYLDRVAGSVQKSATDLPAIVASADAAYGAVDTALAADDVCAIYGQVASALARAAERRRVLLAALRNLFEEVAKNGADLPALPDASPTLRALRREAGEVLENLVQAWIPRTMSSSAAALLADDPHWSSARKAIDQLIALIPELQPDADAITAALKTANQAVADVLKTPPDPATAGTEEVRLWIAGVADTLRRSLEKAGAEEERLLLSLQRFASSDIARAIASEAVGGAVRYRDTAGHVLRALSATYAAVEQARNALYSNEAAAQVGKIVDELFGKLDPKSPRCSPLTDEKARLRAALYVPKENKTCVAPADGKPADDRLTDEIRQLTTANADNAIAVLRQVADLWKKQESAPQRIAAQLEEAGKAVVRAEVVRILDDKIEAARDQIAEKIAALVPVKKTLRSTLDLELKSVNVGLGEFRPTGDKPTLKLTSTATASLEKQFEDPNLKVSVDIKGEVPPFILDIYSIIKFNFKKGIKYTKTAENPGKIDAPIEADDITFGDQLSFLAELSRSLRFGGTDGPYTVLKLDRPSIEAGYRVSIPVITLGVTFTFVNFSGAIVLPFDSGSARVRAALGSLDQPFMISAGIYGGSGYMGLEASPQGIEVFEASFQFGGVASIGFGPLQGTGYVTTGAYVRKNADLGCTFGALFSAGFTAHIACFGVSSTFTLRLLKRQGSSSVEGEAQLTFKFSLGLHDISYTIRVARKMEAGFGGAGRQAATLPGRTRVAALGGFTPDCFPPEQEAHIVTRSLAPPESDWAAYTAQFDPSFRPRHAA